MGDRNCRHRVVLEQRARHLDVVLADAEERGEMLAWSGNLPTLGVLLLANSTLRLNSPFGLGHGQAAAAMASCLVEGRAGEDLARSSLWCKTEILSRFWDSFLEIARSGSRPKT